MYVTGYTGSSDFPTKQPLQAAGGNDAFVTKLGPPRLIAAWGYGTAGQLGHGANLNEFTPVEVHGLNGVSMIAAGLQHSLALKSDGTVWTWGSNVQSQLGYPASDLSPDFSAEHSRLPGQVLDSADPSGFLMNVVAVAGGFVHSLALKSDGTVMTWGENVSGQLGVGCDPPPSICGPPRGTPTPVVGLDRVTKIAAGGAYSMALKDDGTVWTWGGNSWGQLGNGCTLGADCGNPTQVGNLTDIVAIAAGIVHSLALKADGTVWAWGANTSGQLGNGCLSDCFLSTTPVQVPGLSDTVAISAGGYHTLALKADGTVWAWGDASYGQLGDAVPIPFHPYPGTRFVSSPALVIDPNDPAMPLRGIVAIAAGGEHSLAVKTDRTVWSWGSNTTGQLGDGTWRSRSTPGRVENVTNTSAIAAGYGHSLAMLVTHLPNTTTSRGTIRPPHGGVVSTLLLPPSDTVGARVEIGGGALTFPTEITITELPANDPSLPPPPLNTFSRVFRFEPEGQQFNQRVNVFLRYDESEVSGIDEANLQVNLLIGGEYVTVPPCPMSQTPDPAPDPCVWERDPVFKNWFWILTTHFSVWGLSIGPPIVPNRQPTANAGSDQIVECAGPTGTRVMLDGSQSSDRDGDPLTYTWTGSFPEGGGSVTGVTPTVTVSDGVRFVTLTVDDGRGGVSSDTVTITVRDTTAPTVSLSVTPSVLWPPNHDLAAVQVSAVASDNCDHAPVITLVSVVSSEPDDAVGSGDGATVNDIQGADVGTADFWFFLRRERDGGGRGRVYTITYATTDASGNRTETSTTVTVPHDRR